MTELISPTKSQIDFGPNLLPAPAADPVEQPPRVVDGIEAVHFTTRTGTLYVVIRNPNANTYLRLEPHECELVKLMDGTRTLPALVIEDFKKNQVLAPVRVANLVHLLREKRFLTDSPTGPDSTPSRSKSLPLRLARAFLYTELPLKQTDARVSRWYRDWGRWFFTRGAVVLIIGLAALGPILFVAELGRGRYTMIQSGGSSLWNLVLLIGLSLLVLTIHELGHALAVKHAGRYVIRAGLLLYYGLPTAFVDTSDIWMAPPRMRMLASLAGPLTGFLIGGICALLAFLLPEGPFGAFCFAWGLIFLINNLFNFNPLLELDGYYLLIDWVEKPMLRARALAFVRGPFWRKLWRREPLIGEEMGFALFGLSSIVFSVFSIFIALQFWGEQLQKPLQHMWADGDWIMRLILVLLASIVILPFLMTLWSWLKHLAVEAPQRLAWWRNQWTGRHHDEALDILRMSSMWSSLPEAQLLQVARAFRPHSVAPGEQIVRQGEPSQAYYIVARGEFEVLVNGKPVKRLKRGDYFGKRALLDNSQRAAGVIAVTSGVLFSIERDAFHAALAKDAEILVQLELALSYRSEMGGIALLQEMSTTELRPLLNKLIPVSLPAGTVIHTPNVLDDRFYIIRSGQVQILRDEGVYITLGPGEAFNEDGLMENVPITATVRTIAATELLALRAADFKVLVKEHSTRAHQAKRPSHLHVDTHWRLDEVAARTRH